MYRALLNGSVLVPTRTGGGGPENTSFLAAEGPDGRPVLLAFSSEVTLRTWLAQPGRSRTFTAMTGRDLARQARAVGMAGVILDHGSDHSLLLEPVDLDQLADGLVPVRPGETREQVTHAGRRVRLSTARWPAEVLAVMCAAVAEPEVENVHLVDIGYDDGEPGPAVGVGFHQPGGPAVDRVMTDLAARLAAAFPSGGRVDLIVLDDDLHDAVREIVLPVR